MECQRPMRFNAGMKYGWAMGWAMMVAGGAAMAGEWREVPWHEARGGRAGGFEMGRLEVTVGEFVEYLNEAGGEARFPETGQIGGRRDGRYAARRGTARQAVAEVTREEARAFCEWQSKRTGRRIRLPTVEEWEVAARGGVDGAPYPWGWGGEAVKLARFDAEGPAKRGGMFLGNGFGLQDMAGNLWEWCEGGPAAAAGGGVACGGSWAERDPLLLRVDRSQGFPAGYRGRDVGFRVLREAQDGR